MPHLVKRTSGENVTYEHAFADLLFMNSGRTEFGEDFPFEHEGESTSSFISLSLSISVLLCILSRATLIISSSKSNTIKKINLDHKQIRLMIISIQNINWPCFSKSSFVLDLTIHSSLRVQCFPRDSIDTQSSFITYSDTSFDYYKPKILIL